jgi:hypothetical protein
VFKLGWNYPICIYHKDQFVHAKKMLAPTFGRPSSRWYFNSCGSSHEKPTAGHMPPDFDAEVARYYADARLWKSKSHYPRYDFWIVFKTEKDRTLAMMLLG